MVSVMGHPLLTLPLGALVLLVRYETTDRAIGLSALLIGALFIPLAVVMYRNQAKGTYTNFDVSDQAQRQRWYWLALSLLTGVSLLVFITNQPYLIRISLACATLLLGTSLLLNLLIKSSLHVSLNTYLACLLCLFDPQAGGLWLALVPLIGWSRYQLGRHTLAELMVGGMLGLSAGGLFLFLAQ
ncbi:hypothetical protein FAES_3730 [Fibrella aestuarina BUZ 2]|uniref:Phosphatidic acid phosphatase type 2/haloperoxidase domain-containing protein n=2 Tax=Fibrella TaxID=861914 RepID=I0KC84_9BACT|nr:hypothetical protein FAES_3730 [Fibrella aestuarina BUZ 2]